MSKTSLVEAVKHFDLEQVRQLSRLYKCGYM